MQHKQGSYEKYVKRPLDLILSASALIVLFPLLVILLFIGAYMMKGNPFFIQKRPGRHEIIFSLIKFRTMSNEKDENGNLLPDELRLNSYGKFLRSTSLDELPELFNILRGEMSIIGPRPLVPQYLPYYTEEERRRHDVRPGLSGLAQVNGRNALSWEDRFAYDVAYVNDITFMGDVRILWKTVKKVLGREDVVVRGTAESLQDFDVERKAAMNR